MRSVIIFVLAALSGLAQSTPPGGGKVAAVVGPRGSGAPSMGCSAGMLYMRPGTGLYVCTTTDTWALLAAGAGSGDVVGPAASVDGEAAVYDGITGKAIKRFSGSGIGIFTAGVPSVSSALQWNATTGVGLIKPLTLGQFAGDIGTLNLNGTSARVQILPAAATAEWTLTLPANNGSANQVLITDGDGNTSWAAAGAGDVAGPASNTDGYIPQWNGADSKTLKNGLAVASAATANAIAQRNASGEVIAANTVATGKTAMATDTVIVEAQTPLTTKGDLWVTDGSAMNRLAVGTDAYVLTADAASTNGVKWAAATGGGNVTNTGTPTATAIPKYSSTSGTAIAPSGVLIDASDNITGVNSITIDGTGASNITAIAAPAGTPASGTADFYVDSTTKRLATKNDAGTVVDYVGATGNIATATALAANGANCSGSVAIGVDASGACEGTATPTLGTAGSVVGTLAFANATSGSITLSPVTGALGTIAITLPAATGTAVVASTSTTTTQALFATATAGAPAFRALAATDLPGTLSSGTAITNASLTTPSIGAATGTSLVATGIVSGLAPVTYLQDADPCPTGTHCAVGGTYNMGYIINGATTEASATYFDLPAAVAGMQYCFENGAGNSGATTGIMRVIAASGDYITLLGVKSGTSGTTATSNGAAGVAACFIAVKGDEWVMKTSGGTWSTN
jgi:hypothetical protein